MELLEIKAAPSGLMATAVRMRLRLDDLEHIAPEVLERFAAGSATRGEGRAVGRHLLAGCPSCSRRLGRFIPVEHPQEPEGAYDQAFERSLDRAFDVLKLRPAER
jgi:hypothetical protein